MATATVASEPDMLGEMDALGRAARRAAAVLAQAPTETKRQALRAAATAVRADMAALLEANAADMAAATNAGMATAMLDRLALDEARVEAMATGMEEVAALDDPVGRILAEWTRPNGLRIQRVSVPIGVIGIIFESRPNVTADAGALCLMSGNAVILRGGSESFNSSRAIVRCLHQGLAAAGLPEGCIQRVPTKDRAAVGLMLGMADSIDMIIPRGGRSLIERVTNESRIPVLAHLDGICHVYVHGAADIAKARAIALNAFFFHHFGRGYSG